MSAVNIRERLQGRNPNNSVSIAFKAMDTLKSTGPISMQEKSALNQFYVSGKFPSKLKPERFSKSMVSPVSFLIKPIIR